MGLHPVLGRLIGLKTMAQGCRRGRSHYRFWTTLSGKIRRSSAKRFFSAAPMGSRSATIIGVLEPPFLSARDGNMANIVTSRTTSPHHGDGRVHRMTELFARLAPGVTLDQARAELRSVYGAMTKAHPKRIRPSRLQISAKRFVTSSPLAPDRALGAARSVGLVFIIACSTSPT